MHERRRTPRESTTESEVRTRVELADGSVLEGIVVDVSLGGAKVSGGSAGLKTGDKIGLVYLFPSGEKVAYHALVRHVDLEQGCFGVEFLAAPVQIDRPRDGGGERENVSTSNPADSSEGEA